MAYCQIHAQMSEKYAITRADYKIKWKQIGSHSSPDFIGNQFILMRMRDPLFSETMCPCLATPGRQTNLV